MKYLGIAYEEERTLNALTDGEWTPSARRRSITWRRWNGRPPDSGAAPSERDQGGDAAREKRQAVSD